MAAPDGFSTVKSRLIAALKDGRVQHEPREAIAGKNLLAVGAVTTEEVIAVLQRCKGGDHVASDHHLSKLRDCGVKVHCFTTWHGGSRWYIKAYFLAAAQADPEAMFLSVHH